MTQTMEQENARAARPGALISRRGTLRAGAVAALGAAAPAALLAGGPQPDRRSPAETTR